MLIFCYFKPRKHLPETSLRSSKQKVKISKSGVFPRHFQIFLCHKLQKRFSFLEQSLFKGMKDLCISTKVSGVHNIWKK